MDFLYTLLNILLFLFMLGVLVTIHELGHFMIAKLFKVYVFEFSIGFGPKVIPWKGYKPKKMRETKFSVRALPLGGYVSMYGEEGAVPDGFEGLEIDPKRSLKGINRGKRALIMAAGIIMNLILGYTIFLISNGAIAQTQLLSAIKVEANSPLLTAGINNDKVWHINFEETDIDGQRIQYFGVGTINEEDEEYYVLFQPTSLANLDFSGSAIKLMPTNTTKLTENVFYTDFKEGDTLHFKAEFVHSVEDGEPEIINYNASIETVLIDESKPDSGYQLGGLGFGLTSREYRNNFQQTIAAANADFVQSATAVVKGLGSIFTSGLDGFSGPIGIFNMSASILKNQGLSTFLFLWGFISINLALFNLLPFPPLDGWHLLVVTVEAITRREISPKFKNIATMIGSVLMIVLSLLIIGKDIINLFGVPL